MIVTVNYQVNNKEGEEGREIKKIINDQSGKHEELSINIFSFTQAILLW